MHLNVTAYMHVHEGGIIELDTEHRELALELEGFVPYHEECERLLNLTNNDHEDAISDSEEERTRTIHSRKNSKEKI